MEYYVYIIRCQDNSLYTGITTDVERRYEEHKKGIGAKYTKIKKILKLEIFFSCLNRSEASKIEYFIKKMSKAEKENYLNKIKDLEAIIFEKLGIKIEVKKNF
jgi:putative endonuclease